MYVSYIAVCPKAMIVNNITLNKNVSGLSDQARQSVNKIGGLHGQMIIDQSSVIFKEAYKGLR